MRQMIARNCSPVASSIEAFWLGAATGRCRRRPARRQEGERAGGRERKRRDGAQRAVPELLVPPKVISFRLNIHRRPEVPVERGTEESNLELRFWRPQCLPLHQSPGGRPVYEQRSA